MGVHVSNMAGGEMTFEYAFAQLMEIEGYYSNDPDDAGGETKYGISKAQYPDLDIKNLSYKDAQEIYRRDYWNKLQCDSFTDDVISWELFDFGVNAGIEKSARVLQEALNLMGYKVDVDRIIGPQTIHQTNIATVKYAKALINAVRGFQFMHYYGLVLRQPKYSKFIKGWLARI